MSILTATLTDFLTDVPSCLHSTSLTVVLEIFSRGQSDRLIVVDEQKCPVGLVRLQRLLPELLASSQVSAAATASRPPSRPQLEQSISAIPALLDPVSTIPAQLGVEQFRLHLRSQCQIDTKTDTSFDWALVDSSGKFLGLLDSPRLLQFLAASPTVVNSSQAVGGNVDLQDSLIQLEQEQQQLTSELAAKNTNLIQLNRLKDEFLSCISHELKTPLTAVLGLSNLLKDQTLGHLNECQVRYAHLIHQSGRHLMTVVNDILDLTCMETGQLELTLEPVQIRAVCDRAIQQVAAMHPGIKQPQVAEKLLEVSGDHPFVSIEPGLDSLVADELRLRQLLVHLLSNAFKFTEAGGEIGLCVSQWEGWIAFTVWDTGIGIPEQQQHLIFQKFQQLESPLTRRFEGTGLGLVLTRSLARLHGGDVSFLSKEGKGSQFILLLPPSPLQTGDGEIGRWGVGKGFIPLPSGHSSTPVFPTATDWC